MDRLNPLDAVFVDAEDEDRNTSMAIASIAVFEGPAPSMEELHAYFAERLPLLPKYRQKLRTVPFRLARPVWVEDPEFDLSYHLRHTALPKPGGEQQLTDLMARIMSGRLDRDHPLWECWIVERLAGHRWAMITKMHHCMVDGVSGTDLYRALLGCSPEREEPAADERVVGAEPTVAALVAGAAADTARPLIRAARTLTGALAERDRTVRRATELGRAITRLSHSVRPAVKSSLTGRIGQERRYAVARASLDDIKLIKRELGGTVNDVVLAAISGGFRALLLSRGEQPCEHEVPSLVPVSLRAPGEENIYENRVSATVADLPVHIADPVGRLTAVQAELDSLKASREAMVGEALISLGGLCPYPLTSWWVRTAFRLPQREIVTVTTNVPGPLQPLFCLGRRLEEIIPYVPIASRVRIGISVLSYHGNIAFGITGDFTANPDLEVLAHGIEQEISGLLRCAKQTSPEVAGAEVSSRVA